MPRDYFAFKQFTINHSRCAMKVNTDGCLLGSWAKSENPKYILDIGAGTGVVGLMLAQRFAAAHIDLVEIEPTCAEQSETNAENSPFRERVTTYNLPIQTFSPSNYFDLIVSNPPYFENATPSADEKRQLARHHQTLNLQHLILHTKRLLHSNGDFCVILPAERTEEFLAMAAKNELFLHEEVALRSLPHKPITRYLLRLNRVASQTHASVISIEETPGIYSQEVQQWLSPFYLHL